MPSPKEFLDALWTGVEGLAFARIYGPDGAFRDASFAWPSEADALLTAIRDPGGLAYVGAGLRTRPSIEKACVAGVSAFWATFNLLDVPMERAAEALKAFPARASAGLVVDRALHAFWFLKTPLAGQALDCAWTANRTAVAKLRLGGVNGHNDPVLLRACLQANHYDFDGLIRAPGQPGARFVAWRPEARYSVEEFADLVCPRPPAPAPSAAQAQAPPERAVLIEGDDAHKLADFIRGMWLEGTLMPSFLAGMFVKSGVALESAKAILSEAVQMAGGDAEKCAQHVESTYRRAAEGKPVSEKGALQKLFDQHYPPDDKERAKKKLERLEKLLPKRKESDPPADFAITKLVKFDSRPARWSVTLRLSTNEDVAATVETQTFHQFIAFQSALQEQTHVMLMDIRQSRWKRMIGEARQMIEVKETPKEARPEGAIESAIEEFFADAKEKPDVGMLRSFSAYDDEGRFFRYIAFKDFLRENGARFEDRVIYEHLKQLGFKNTVKRFGAKLQRLWLQAYEGNGNGHGPSEDPKENVPVAPQASLDPIPDLFLDEKGQKDDRGTDG